MAKISVTDFKPGIDQAETEATCHATELADKEHQIQCQLLEAEAINSARSLAAAKTVHEFKAADLHDHAILVGSLVQDNERAQAKVWASSWKHEVHVADLDNRPPPPLRRRPSWHPHPPDHHRRPPPLGPSAVPSPTLGPRSPPAIRPQPTTFDDSYLDVRVSAFRHRNEEFPPAVRDQIFDLSLAVFLALRPVRQTKAPLRLARDLGSS